MKRWFVSIVFFAVGMFAQADEAAQQRELELAAKLRCLVCQNQSIAESSAPLALDLRKQIREQMTAGKSDAEILGYMTARYGDFVLYRPPFKGITLLLWLGPALLLGIGALIAWRVMVARKRAFANAALTPEEHARAEQLLSGTAAATTSSATTSSNKSGKKSR